jgi:phage terminase large subunit-like protein
VNELDAFCRFCREQLTTEQGKPLVIEPFQRQILEDIFAGTRETIVVVGKKNGKTSLFAALALFHLLTVPFADVAIVAAARDQARKLLDQLVGYVRRSPALRERLRITQREVRHEQAGGVVRALASDSDTLDGWGGTLALVDELGRHKSEENFGLLRDGLGARAGQLVAISTAGDDEESALGRLRAAAHAMEGFARDPGNRAHKHVRSNGFAYHEWSLDPGDEIDDLELLKLANPASWIDEAELRARRDSPSTQRWQLARFTAGLWVAGEESAISGKEWGECAEPGIEIPAGTEGVFVGIDLGWKWDTTALVPVWRPGEEPIVVHPPAILTPPGDGTSLDAEDVFAVCQQYVKRWPGCSFVLDPEAGGEQLGQRLEREIPTSDVWTYSQKTTPMCAASQRLAETIAAGEIRHPDHEGLNRHVLSASAKFIGPVWRFVKPRGKKLPIDACIALAMGVEMLARQTKPRESVYNTRGMIVA